MLWFFQVYKLLKMTVSFLKSASETLSKVNKPGAETSEEVATVEIPEEEKEAVVIVEETDLIEDLEEIASKNEKCNSAMSTALGVLGFVAGFLGVVYVINEFVVPKYSRGNKTLTGDLKHFKVEEGVLGYYKDGQGDPLLLIHGLNPGGSSHEMEVFFNYYRNNRTVYSLDLLGFGASERPNIEYNSNIYVKQIKDFLNHIKIKYDKAPDVICLGQTTEFLVAIAESEPELVNKLVLISPTGLENNVDRMKLALNKAVISMFKLPIVGQGMFNLMTSKTILKQYLSNKIFVEPRNLSYLMLQQYYHTTHVQGAKNAPSYAVAGELIIENLFQKYLNMKVGSLIIHGQNGITGSKFNAVPTVVNENDCIESKVIQYTGFLPHIEKTEKVFGCTDKFL